MGRNPAPDSESPPVDQVPPLLAHRGPSAHLWQVGPHPGALLGGVRHFDLHSLLTRPRADWAARRLFLPQCWSVGLSGGRVTPWSAVPDFSSHHKQRSGPGSLPNRPRCNTGRFGRLEGLGAGPHSIRTRPGRANQN